MVPLARKQLNKIKKALKPKQPVLLKKKELINFSKEYRALRKACLIRDGFRCRHCHKKKRRLEMDHIFPRSTHPHLLLEMSNCRMLCRKCHKETPTYGKQALRYREVGKLDMVEKTK
jgi:5-methylcytosine-specific restriction endonuclease McrA